ncbi:MAG: YihA family ribosome biogenesis GTP-binding protein [Deltaproteobacteria bacterium]|nr:YihA family ribosome biogenesis GTP-binding protein [Deltaproteobacteria bacterium]
MRKQAGGARFLGSFAQDLPELGLPEVAFAGRSNVGKSSCLNRLLGSKKAARVSGTPGRTQRINLFQLGNALAFADLPGYGFAKVPEEIQAEWKGMIEGYLGERADLRLVVVLVDARRTPQESDGVMVYGLRQAKLPLLVVATKIDKLTRNERFKALGAIRRDFGLKEEELVPFSSLTGEGKDLLWDRIEAACR